MNISDEQAVVKPVAEPVMKSADGNDAFEIRNEAI